MLQDRNFGTVNGTNGYVLFYNKTLFDEAGVGYPTMEWTWDDFVEAAKALTKVRRRQDGPIRHDRRAPTRCSKSCPGLRAISSTRVMPDKSLFDTDAVVWGLGSSRTSSTRTELRPRRPEASAMLWPTRGETGQVAMIGHSFAIEHRSLIEDWEWDIAHVPMGEQRRRLQRRRLPGRQGFASAADREFAKWFMMDRPQGVFSLDGLGSADHALLRV